ncbi:MAG: family 1 glycosylhydrolase [Oscillospiraceae bacterium]|nr:family 1 glycosylhydrolase [Oscillospiraceae bacterium]
MEFRFPEGLLLGAATAATQIEGGETDHSWLDWARRGHIKDGSSPARADDHWERWREDVDLMASLGLRVCRFGVEWSRLVPERGKPDADAIDHYRGEIAYMREKGIAPLLTIHHFTNPMWFERRGGFLKRENLQDYLDLVELVVSSFGDLVSEYITINEPNVYAMNGYAFGSWPPGEKSLRDTFRVLSNLSFCHIRAYQIIHSMRREMGFDDTKVSFANHVRVFDPKNPRNPLHRAAAAMTAWMFQGAVTRAMCRGEFRPPLRSPWPMPRGEYADFIGVNYYARSTVSGFADGVRENSPRNDLDWEIYPEGLVRCARSLYGVLPRPLYVTENGTCDNGDAFRARYICEHLAAMAASGLPFERYYHWCFCDNFEWLEGESARFGLVHVDYGTQLRTVKRSGRFYAGMIAAGGVTQALYDEYVKGEVYRIK